MLHSLNLFEYLRSNMNYNICTFSMFTSKMLFLFQHISWDSASDLSGPCTRISCSIPSLEPLKKVQYKNLSATNSKLPVFSQFLFCYSYPFNLFPPFQLSVILPNSWLPHSSPLLTYPSPDALESLNSAGPSERCSRVS